MTSSGFGHRVGQTLCCQCSLQIWPVVVILKTDWSQDRTYENLTSFVCYVISLPFFVLKSHDVTVWAWHSVIIKAEEEIMRLNAWTRFNVNSQPSRSVGLRRGGYHSLGTKHRVPLALCQTLQAHLRKSSAILQGVLTHHAGVLIFKMPVLHGYVSIKWFFFCSLFLVWNYWLQVGPCRSEYLTMLAQVP